MQAIIVSGPEHTVNNEFKPHITSFRRRVGAQPRPSIEFWRKSDKQMSPVTEIFGCHSFVAHLTFGGYKITKKNFVSQPIESRSTASYRHIVLFRNAGDELELAVFPKTFVWRYHQRKLT